MAKPKVSAVFRSLNRPMLLLGIDRRLFFFLLCASFALFNLSNALAPAAVLFAVLWCGARMAQGRDPQLLRIVLNSRRWRRRYDPGKFCPEGEKGGGSRGSAQ
jgi:type IV secretory pathway VirB3-like protein